MALMGCDQGDRFKDSKGKGGINTMQNGAINLRMRTGVDENSYLLIKVHYPKYINVSFAIVYIFLLCRLKVKNKPREGAKNMLAWLQQA